jgi:hypothetical protein
VFSWGIIPFGSRAGIAAVAALVLTPLQFGAFDCNELPLLSFASGLIAFGAGTFGVLSVFARQWWAAIGGVLLAVLAGAIMVMSHMCG